MSARAIGLTAPRLDSAGLALGAAALVALAAASVLLADVRGLLALVALVGFGLLLLYPQATVCILVAASPLEGALRPISGSGSLSLTKLLGVVLIVGFALHAVAARTRLRGSASLVIVVLILVIALASTSTAAVTSDAVAVLTRYGGFVAAFIVIAQLATSARMLTAIAWSFAAGAAAAAAFGLGRFLLGYPGPVNLPDSDKNDLAFTLVVALPIILWLMQGSRARRFAVGVAASVTAAALLLTTSRGALVGVGAMIVWYVATERRHVIAILSGVLAVLVLAVGVVSLNQAAFDAVLQHRGNQASKNVDSRLDAWRGATQLAVENPVLGVGPGNFRHRYLEVIGAPIGAIPLSVAHNTYLDISAELGLLAGLLFVLLLLCTYLYLSRARVEGRGPPGYATALRVSLIGAVAAGSFLSEQYFIPFWLISALAVAVATSAIAPRGGAQA